MKNQKQLAIMLGMLAMYQSMQGAMVSGARQLGQGLGGSAAQIGTKAAPTALTGISALSNPTFAPNFTSTQPALTAPTYPISYAGPKIFGNPAGQTRFFSTNQLPEQNFIMPANLLLMPTKEESIIFLQNLLNNKSLSFSTEELSSFLNHYFTVFTYEDLINITSKAQISMSSMSLENQRFYNFEDEFKRIYFNEYEKKQESTTNQERYNLLKQVLKVKTSDLEKITELTEKYSKAYFYEIILEAQKLKIDNSQEITLKTILNIIKKDQLKKQKHLLDHTITEKKQKIITMLNSQLSQKPNSINIPFIAQLLNINTSIEDIKKLIDQATIIAGNHTLNTNHLREALLTLDIGPKDNKPNSTETYQKTPEITIHYPKGVLRSTAIHEASHVIAEINGENPTFVATLTIEPRSNIMGYANYSPLYDTKDDNLSLSYITTCIAGTVGEQIFDTYRYQGYSNEMLTDKNEIFSFLNNRIGASGDMKQAVEITRKILLSQKIAKDKLEPMIKEIIANCYKKAYQLIDVNKDNVQKLVDTAMKKGTLHEDEIYQILNIPRPLYHFEQGAVPQAEMTKISKYRFPAPEDSTEIAQSMPAPKIDSEKYYDSKKVALNKIEITGKAPTAARSIYAIPATSIKASTATPEAQLPPDHT